MESWQLPDYISDLLPPKAHQLEKIREKILYLFRSHGYQLVSPALIEYTSSLLVNNDEGLTRKTIQVTDQISGQQLGIRSDITTQITRIDAHLSCDNSIHRFCYAGPTLHAVPQSLVGTREPLQVGAEIFGHTGVGADIEIIELMLDCIQIFPIPEIVLSLAHVDIFNSLLEEAQIPNTRLFDLIKLLTIKDSKAVEQLLTELSVPSELKLSFIALTSLYGHQEIMKKAKTQLIQTPRIKTAIIELEQIIAFFEDYPVYIDLSELRSDRYHTGLLYGVYAKGWPSFLAKGGRYNNLGSFFGKARPATGFSLDLKDFLSIIPEKKITNAIKVSVQDYEPAKKIIEQLRKNGEIVIIEYDHTEIREDIACDRQIELLNNEWVINPCH